MKSLIVNTRTLIPLYFVLSIDSRFQKGLQSITERQTPLCLVHENILTALTDGSHLLNTTPVNGAKSNGKNTSINSTLL